MAIVAWDIVSFLDMYPQFSECGEMAMSETVLDSLFEVACSIVDNTEGGMIPYDPGNGVKVRKIVLYALVCHLATLNKWGANGQSGPLSNASEGSVSVGFQTASYKQGGELATWLRQTPCGQTAWLLISRFAAGPRLYGVGNYHPYG